jgi:hypothetical protein
MVSLIRTGTIKPRLQQFQFCHYGTSLGILFFSILSGPKPQFFSKFVKYGLYSKVSIEGFRGFFVNTIVKNK